MAGSDEQDLFEQEAIELAEAAAAAEQEEVPTREVHELSPELVTPESLAAAAEEAALPDEPPDGLPLPEVPAEAAPEAPAEAPPAAAIPPGYVPPGYVPHGALHQAKMERNAARDRADAALGRVEELSSGLQTIQEQLAREETQKQAAAADAAIPDLNKDPVGYLRTTTVRDVLAGLQPILDPIVKAQQAQQATLGKLDGLVGQTEEQLQARETEKTLRQAYTMQDQAAMAGDPDANAAIRLFHQGRYEFHLAQGYDEATAGHLANEDRFHLYKNSGSQDGPGGLVQAWRNLGMSPVQALRTAQSGAAQPPQVPAAPQQVPMALPVQQQVPPGPRRIDEMPPPVRRRRPSESESTAMNYLLHHWDEISPNQLDSHIMKVREEEGITESEAYARVMKAREARLRQRTA